MRSYRLVAVLCFALAVVCYLLPLRQVAPALLIVAVVAELVGWMSLLRAEQKVRPSKREPRA